MSSDVGTLADRHGPTRARSRQILGNFLSNAAKFTEQGEIRLAAATGPGDAILFSVADTGIGTAPAD